MKLFAKITNPNAGYDPDKEQCSSLIADYPYEVDRVEIGRSHTNVYFVSSSRVFNSANLSFFISEDGLNLKPYNIFDNDLDLKNIYSSYICFKK